MVTGMIKTNKDWLVKQVVMGQVSHPRLGAGYSTTFEGKAKIVPGTAGIKLNFRVGDCAYGWIADHLEPGVNIQNRGSPREFSALNAFACIGNEAKIVSGDAKGSIGVVTGKHGWTSTFVDFPQEVLSKLAIDDRVQVVGWGVGLAVEGMEGIRIMSLSPSFFEAMGVKLVDSCLGIPVVAEVEGRMMGSGMGGGSGGISDLGDFDIQSTCPELTEKYGLSKIRSGDLVAIEDMLCHYARGIYQGAITIGIVSHAASEHTGHGPGVNPLISAFPGRVKPIIDPRANIAYYLGLRPDLSW